MWYTLFSSGEAQLSGLRPLQKCDSVNRGTISWQTPSPDPGPAVASSSEKDGPSLVVQTSNPAPTPTPAPRSILMQTGGKDPCPPDSPEPSLKIPGPYKRKWKNKHLLNFHHFQIKAYDWNVFCRLPGLLALLHCVCLRWGNNQKQAFMPGLQIDGHENAKLELVCKCTQLVSRQCEDCSLSLTSHFVLP